MRIPGWCLMLITWQPQDDVGDKGVPGTVVTAGMKGEMDIIAIVFVSYIPE